MLIMKQQFPLNCAVAFTQKHSLSVMGCYPVDIGMGEDLSGPRHYLFGMAIEANQ